MPICEIGLIRGPQERHDIVRFSSRRRTAAFLVSARVLAGDIQLLVGSTSSAVAVQRKVLRARDVVGSLRCR